MIINIKNGEDINEEEYTEISFNKNEYTGHELLRLPEPRIYVHLKSGERLILQFKDNEIEKAKDVFDKINTIL